MKRALHILLFAFILLCSSFNNAGGNIDVHDILNRLFNKVTTVQTLYYKLIFKERSYESNKVRTDSSITKYQKTPRRVYIKLSNGTEVLWGPDMNDGDALVHPNSFPYFNVNLNPNGSMMRKNQHHGIDATGFDYFSALLQSAVARAGKDFDSHFFYQGDIAFNGYQCINIVVIDPGFKYVPYTVKAGETILTIAQSQHLNEYMILKHNPKVSSYTDVKAGQTILIPTNYGMQVKLYIDKNTMLPVMIRADDENGLFEEYDFKNLKLNPNFSPDEFSRDNKNYHF